MSNKSNIDGRRWDHRLAELGLIREPGHEEIRPEATIWEGLPFHHASQSARSLLVPLFEHSASSSSAWHIGLRRLLATDSKGLSCWVGLCLAHAYLECRDKELHESIGHKGRKQSRVEP